MRIDTLSGLCALIISTSVLAITPGQVDTFGDGTTQGWFVPGLSATPPVNILTGGPAGAGDPYLQLTATGGTGPGSRLSVLNDEQWTGNYPAAGITLIRMDVSNFGPDDLHLRLLLEDLPDEPGPPLNLALSADAIVVPAGSGWRTIEFPIAPADLLPGGIGTVAGALADVNTLRIFHNPDPTFPGPLVGIPTVNVILGVDNITAVPEPASATLLALATTLLLTRRQRKSESA